MSGRPQWASECGPPPSSVHITQELGGDDALDLLNQELGVQPGILSSPGDAGTHSSLRTTNLRPDLPSLWIQFLPPTALPTAATQLANTCSEVEEPPLTGISLEFGSFPHIRNFHKNVREIVLPLSPDEKKIAAE